jgi:colanic acid/amylovoran biosynthesis protein
VSGFLVTNSVALNGGDAAILMGLHRGLRAAFGEAPVAVADDAWTAAAAAYPELSFVPPLHGSSLRGDARLGGLSRSLRRRRVSAGRALLETAPGLARAVLPPAARAQLGRLESTRAAISTGGTYLVEHYPLRRRLESIDIPARLGVPTYLYTQSLGPFRAPGAARAVAAVLSRVRKIFLRDERSRAHLLEIGVAPDKLGVFPDAAFALARGPGSKPDGAPAVAISVRHWGHYVDGDAEAGQRDYRRSIAAAARALVEVGASVTFLSTCQGQPAYRTDDARYARRIVEEELDGVPAVRVDGGFRTPGELVDELARYRMVIATRMHFAILALCAGVPVAPIAYEFKTAELFEGLGWGERVVALEGITPERLVAAVEHAYASAESDRARVAELLPALRDGALEPARVIRDDLRGSS